MMDSLWGDDFVVETKEKTKKIINKIAKPKEPKVAVEKQIKSKSISIADRLLIINSNVLSILGKYKENILVIKTYEQLVEYIDTAIYNGIIDIDTETNNSLDPLTCKLMGPCIYTPSKKQAYIPINHINYVTGERLSWQLTEEQVAEQFNRLIEAKTKVVMHNAKFDYKVLKCTLNKSFTLYWDTMIAARLLNENEPSAGLKQQYIDKINSDQTKYSIDHLFENVEYAWVDPDIFALYAATDAFMTHELYEYQYNILTNNPELADLYKLFTDIEMPLVQVVAEMELSGIDIDQEYAVRLSSKYNKLLEQKDLEISQEMEKYESKISAWRISKDANEVQYKLNKKTGEKKASKSKSEQLANPISLTSPIQLAILLYDILKVGIIDNKKPRGTGEDILVKIVEKMDLPLCDLILERRGLAKLLSTYIDKIPTVVNPFDGRLHCNFNQMGTDTGRFSSSDPNLQNIPSHNKEIRMLFKSRDGYTLVGGDFSQQEPRLTAHYSNDPDMLKAYQEGKSLYSVIAANMYDNNYEDNLEFYPEGTIIKVDGKDIVCGNKTHVNKAGKDRRGYAKSVLLGLLYGRGAASIAEQINKTREEAQEIIDKFFKAFPKVKEWIDNTIKDAYKTGFVEDFAGRRRSLPDIQLPRYDIKSKNSNEDAEFNPFLICSDRVDNEFSKLVKKYETKLKKARNKRDVDSIKKDAEYDGLHIHDNGGYISQAERQAVNSRVQGGAATLTKYAMIKIFNDELLNELEFKMLVTVHDEVFGECPDENVEQVSKQLIKVMVDSAKDFMDIPMDVDTYEVKAWYFDEYSTSIVEEFKKSESKGLTKEEALSKLYEEHTEVTKECLDNIINSR